VAEGRVEENIATAAFFEPATVDDQLFESLHLEITPAAISLLPENQHIQNRHAGPRVVRHSGRPGFQYQWQKAMIVAMAQ
jgi:hypothetical protein